MYYYPTRRRFLIGCGAAAAGAALPVTRLLAGTDPPAKARVVIARDDALQRGEPSEHGQLLAKLLDAAVQKLTDTPDPVAAWRRLFSPRQRVGIKVNALGRATQPVVVDAIVAGLRQAGVPAEHIIIWDRFDTELVRAGFKLNKTGDGVRCRGTDADKIGSGYQSEVEKSGEVGTCFSRILTDEVDTLISVPVLKDHNLAGVSLGMKNFYGAIHNPNKYHGNNCDPYIADVVAHRYIGPRWRLTVVDGTRAQYHGGPGLRPAHTWLFGGLIVGTDFVAVDAVGAHLLDEQRRSEGMKPVAEDGRPARHIATAGTRGLGVAELDRIERIEV